MLLTEYNEKQHIESEKGISFTQGEDNAIDLMIKAGERINNGESPQDIIEAGFSEKIVNAALKMLGL